MAARQRSKKPHILQAEIETLLAQQLPDATLRSRLEELSHEPAFAGLTWRWGPELYHRSRVMFRPFILAHFSMQQWTGGWFPPWRPVTWDGPRAAALDRWLAEVEANEDAELFRLLYRWKTAAPRWRKRGVFEVELRSLLAAPLEDPDLRLRLEVLAQHALFGQFAWLWGPALYRRNRVMFRPFLLERLLMRPWAGGCLGFGGSLEWTGKTTPILDAWLAEVETNEDAELCQLLYRWKVSARQWQKPHVFEAELRALLDAPLDDSALRWRLEVLAGSGLFAPQMSVWGPALYRRNPTVFLPFILTYFPSQWLEWQFRWFLPWRGERARVLDAWFAEADAKNEVHLFRLLYLWRSRSGKPRLSWAADLLSRYQAATRTEERALVLDKFSLNDPAERVPILDETTATVLYQTDPPLARPFILRYFPYRRGLRGSPKRGLPEKVCAAVKAQGDEDFSCAIYRKAIPLRDWERDALRLCDEIASPDDLVNALEKRHPETTSDLGGSFYRLLLRRGADVLAYVLRHRQDVRSRGWLSSYNRLLKLARARGWEDLWASLLYQYRSPQTHDYEVRRLVADRILSDAEVSKRLLVYATTMHGGAAFATLSDATAVTLYERFPDLTRDSFRPQLVLSSWEPHVGLTAAVLASGDPVLTDHLAGRAAVQVWHNKKLLAVIEQLAIHYESLLREDPEEFAWRATAVLSALQAYSIGNYDLLVRNNRLARLLFERSATAHLSNPHLVRDLLEAPEIHVQVLALHTLALDDDRARALAADNLDLLLATPLRALHRRTRLVAFRALFNAATTPENARVIHDRARQALDLPDKGYPKEQLLGLIGRLLHRWPELRNSGEQPFVHRREAP